MQQTHAPAILVARRVVKCIGQNNNAGTKARVIGNKFAESKEDEISAGRAARRRDRHGR